MNDVEIWRAFRGGMNTYEIAKASNMQEYDVDYRLHRIRRQVREHNHRAAERAKAKKAERKTKPRPKPKLGFTGFDTVSGYPRGRM